MATRRRLPAPRRRPSSRALARRPTAHPAVPPPQGGLSTGTKVALGIAAAALLVGIAVYSSTASAAQAQQQPSNPSNPSSGLSPTDGGRGQAATALAQAIQTAGGYQGSQNNAIVSYQQAAGLTTDGYPGTTTMTNLRNDLNAMGTASQFPTVFSIGLYGWVSSAGWTSGNVPAAFVNNQAAWTAGTAVGT